MSIATALQAKIDEKEAIRLAIEGKGVTVTTSVKLSGYASKIGEILTGTSNTSNDPTYTRPPDWLEIDSLVTAPEQKFVGLYAIFEIANYLAFKFEGNYTVDWGDGIIQNFASGVIAQHQYDYNYAGFNGTESTRGYKQAIVTITPNGGDLTLIDLKETHSGAIVNYPMRWLDIKTSVPELTSGYFTCGLCEILKIVGTNKSTWWSQSFEDMSALRILEFYMSPLTTYAYNLFSGCRSLNSVPFMNTDSVYEFTSMFSGCSSLKTIPNLNTGSATNMRQMFYNCPSLEEIPLLDTSNVTDMKWIFRNCSVLKEIPLFNTIKVTNMEYMLYACTLIQRIPALNYSAVTNMRSFAGATFSLIGFADIYAPFCSTFFAMFDGSGIIKGNLIKSDVSCNFKYLYQVCSKLTETTTLDLGLSNSSLTSVYTNGQAALTTIYPLNVKTSISVTNSNLDRTNLLRLFNALVIGTGQTVTITNSIGAVNLTALDRAIATDKGWTIVG